MPYDASTNWQNEENYLNNLIAQGGGNATWAQNQLGVLNAAKQKYTSFPVNGSPFNFDSALGDYQNALDQITRQSDKVDARSLEYAMQNQEWSANQAAIAREYNAAEAAKARDWQQYMSNTAHQREVADLRAAGLNPVLSAMNGNGASVGSGATASVSAPSGASAEVDRSRNSALVGLLGSMLSAQTSLTNQLVSARTQEAVADKYTAMSEITAGIAAAASMYGADTQYRIQQDFPNNLWRVLGTVLSSIDPSSDTPADFIHSFAKFLTGKGEDSFFGSGAAGFKDTAKVVSTTANEVAKAVDVALNDATPGNKYGSAKGYGASGKGYRYRENK